MPSKGVNLFNKICVKLYLEILNTSNKFIVMELESLLSFVFISLMNYNLRFD